MESVWGLLRHKKKKRASEPVVRDPSAGDVNIPEEAAVQGLTQEAAATTSADEVLKLRKDLEAVKYQCDLLAEELRQVQVQEEAVDLPDSSPLPRVRGSLKHGKGAAPGVGGGPVQSSRGTHHPQEGELQMDQLNENERRAWQQRVAELEAELRSTQEELRHVLAPDTNSSCLPHLPRRTPGRPSGQHRFGHALMSPLRRFTAHAHPSLATFHGQSSEDTGQYNRGWQYNGKPQQYRSQHSLDASDRDRPRTSGSEGSSWRGPPPRSASRESLQAYQQDISLSASCLSSPAPPWAPDLTPRSQVSDAGAPYRPHIYDTPGSVGPYNHKTSQSETSRGVTVGPTAFSPAPPHVSAGHLYAPGPPEEVLEGWGPRPGTCPGRQNGSDLASTGKPRTGAYRGCIETCEQAAGPDPARGYRVTSRPVDQHQDDSRSRSAGWAKDINGRGPGKPMHPSTRHPPETPVMDVSCQSDQSQAGLRQPHPGGPGWEGYGGKQGVWGNGSLRSVGDDGYHEYPSGRPLRIPGDDGRSDSVGTTTEGLPLPAALVTPFGRKEYQQDTFNQDKADASSRASKASGRGGGVKEGTFSMDQEPYRTSSMAAVRVKNDDIHRQIEELKQAGNRAFQREDYPGSYQRYTEALVLAQDDPALCAVLYCNRAAALHNMKMFLEAIADCYCAGYADPTYIKVLQRRADAYCALGDYSNAAADLRRLFMLGGCSNVQARLREVEYLAQQGSLVNYYTVLGLSSRASLSDIKSQYKKLALKFHPDKATSEAHRAAAEALFQLVAQANALLSDPVKKATYDLMRAKRKVKKFTSR